MFARVVAFCIMSALLLIGWQWPRLLPWDDARALELGYRASWLVCIAVPCWLLVCCVLRRPWWQAGILGWLMVSMLVYQDGSAFRVTELTGQAGLALLWLEAAWVAPTVLQRRLSYLALAVHLSIATVAVVAKVQAGVFVPDHPDIIERAFGPAWTTLVYLPAGLALAALAWAMRRA